MPTTWRASRASGLLALLASCAVTWRASAAGAPRLPAFAAPGLVGGGASPAPRSLRLRGRAQGGAPLMMVSGGSRKKVVVVGGTGRVGGSAARWMLEFGEEENTPVDVVLCGRNAGAYDKCRQRLLRRVGGAFADRISFSKADFEDPSQIRGVLEGADLVIHTAGPFQQRKIPQVLDAAIAQGVPYVDVCDEKQLCVAAKGRRSGAESAGVPAIVAAGIWPGVSAVLAAACVDQMRSEGVDAEEIEMSFFTAGTGNAGATIVAATFLLLVEPVLCFVNGQAVEEEPWRGKRTADFGGGVGRREVWLLDNPDVWTLGECIGVPNISSRFATAPQAWNYLFGGLQLIPASLLGDQTFARLLSQFSDPVIRVVDAIVGATNAMRIDVRGGGKTVTARVTHDDLENCVGIGTAAFGMELLLGRVKPGVHFPPELRENRRSILSRAKRDSCQWEIPG